jgi:hypothetical protein
MRKIVFNNGLSLFLSILFFLTLFGQFYSGYNQYNEELKDWGKPAVSTAAYFKSGHFLEATFENWESEFLQMGVLVVCTIFLKQKGSSESKKFDGTDEVDREPNPRRKDAPYPVKKGGWLLKIYKHSLSIALFALFFFSMALHFYGSWEDENTERMAKGIATISKSGFLFSSRFWFESFQNWQSEFLSVCSIIVLSIFLRQKGSPQSKPVDAPIYQTEE